jgi:membrane protein YdbS with pleckstrin-like domain
MNPYVKHLLSDNETELSETHQHPFWLISQMWKPLLVLLVIIVLIIFSGNIVNIGISQADINAGQGRPNFMWWMLLIVAIIPLIIIAIEYIRWRNHIYVVTNERVITLSGVVNKSSYDIALEKINDISTSQSLLGRMFNFGDITLESGNDQPVLMHGIASPLEFKKSLLDAKSGMMGGPAASAAYRSAAAAGPVVNPIAPPVVSAPANMGGGSASALRELEELRSQGLINDAEYAQKRAEILRRM